MALTEATLNAANTWSEPVIVPLYTQLAVAVSGNFDGTLTLQLLPQLGGIGHDWVDETTFDAPDIQLSRELRFGPMKARIGFKLADYTSGTARCSLQVVS